MSRNSYNNIKKYAAFLFMIFTVLSGSSESFDSNSVLRTGKNAFIDILVINKLFIQGIKASISDSGIKKSVEDHKGFKDFLDINADTSNQKYVQGYILPLTVSAYCVNDSIAKNNTWQSTLF